MPVNISSPSSTLGSLGERLAAGEYIKSGHKIIGINVRMHQSRQVGEIDIIAIKEKEIVFVEVKTRKSRQFGEPADAVNIYKQRKLIRAAKLFLLRHPQYDSHDWRFDVAEVHIDKNSRSVKILTNVIEDLN